MLLSKIPKEAPSAATRRAPLKTLMADQIDAGIHCHQCVGTCCTFVANSMQVTPLEAIDLLAHLVDTGRWHQATVSELESNIRRFRLNTPPPGDGKRSFSRRRYTCPFYAGQARGCTISRDAKPYGCLAFNPFSPHQTNGGDCGSQEDALAPLDSPELEAVNTALKTTLSLDWDKKPIPTALLDLIPLVPPTSAE